MYLGRIKFTKNTLKYGESCSLFFKLRTLKCQLFVCVYFFFSLETKTMKNLLETIRSNSNNLSGLAGDLDTGLTDARSNLTDIQKECKSFFSSPPFCNNIDVGNLAADANFTNLPNITSELQRIEDVLSQNFEKSAEDVSLIIHRS